MFLNEELEAFIISEIEKFNRMSVERGDKDWIFLLDKETIKARISEGYKDAVTKPPFKFTVTYDEDTQGFDITLFEQTITIRIQLPD